MNDLTATPTTFEATTMEIVATTEAGRDFLGSMFGTGAVSIELPKSKAIDFAEFVERKGLKIG